LVAFEAKLTYSLRASPYTEIRQSNCCYRTSAPLTLRIQEFDQVGLVAGEAVPGGLELPHAVPANRGLGSGRKKCTTGLGARRDRRKLPGSERSIHGYLAARIPVTVLGTMIDRL
jgi:hypothetical protein